MGLKAFKSHMKGGKHQRDIAAASHSGSRFPKDNDVRKKWEVALRREGFTASASSVHCSQHFKQDDFDRTGQIVRLKDGVIPSVFSFPVHLQRDHGYALPASPTALKTRLNEALARVESLEREKKNAMAREKRAKITVNNLLGDLKKNNLINEELKEKLEFYSGLQSNCNGHRTDQLENHKMRVSLAAQTLSRSVSVGLRTMRDLGYSQFKDCEATAEFTEVLDVSTWYLSVLGFVINIDTFMRMIPELLQVQRYVLTYRFSQDHLELLFNSIRASGGWNNNPSARQFQAIFRRLMVRCGVSPGETGNVAAQDSTV
ncbi:THAP domain-containing 6-like protein [Labeo rohita]|uniref:THAP domain-containing 6-like protein n=1 Tax=Labeo rohita TaxID=84645 RepID=A0A498M066_LABRO|nr:THAP domain-containing 6-like protein [Labeo rohita]